MTGSHVRISLSIGESTTDLSHIDELPDAPNGTPQSNGVMSSPVIGNISGPLVTIVDRVLSLPLDPEAAVAFVKVRFGGFMQVRYQCHL
jgi:hypothetical protein